jgi:EAL domain-containing protein (putative c-di-GMP-specific phosphodiesterase class I)
MAARHVPVRLLELEATELAIMIDPRRPHQILELFCALEVRIFLDDFASDTASLSQFKALPISEIRIDRSFVKTMAQDRNDSLIVQSVISLGHDRGLSLVAEGVWTQQGLTALAGLGCDVAQGYHISEPIPVAVFDIWMPSTVGV